MAYHSSDLRLFASVPVEGAPVVFIRMVEGDDVRPTALPRFMLLYAAIYAGFGVASPSSARRL